MVPNNASGESGNVVRLTDHETFVFDSGGKKRPVVLLHAMSMDHRMWREVIPLLSPDYRVIAYDLRGFGRAAEAPLAKNVPDFCTDLDALLNHLALEKTILIGISFGGIIAQNFTLLYPDRVDVLGVLASTAWSSPFFNARAEAAERDGMSALVAPSLARWFTAESLAQNGWGVQYAKQCVENTRVASWATGWRAMGSMDFSDRLSEIKNPAFVVAGEVDPSTPIDMMQKLATAFHAGMECIPSASHMLPLEKPVETAAAILRGIKK
jgi:3-oxoadipate enol-lactonase